MVNANKTVKWSTENEDSGSNKGYLMVKNYGSVEVIDLVNEKIIWTTDTYQSKQ